MRPRVVAANWKMHTVYPEARHLAHQLRRSLEAPLRGAEQLRVILCPPAIWITELAGIIERSPLNLGAQDVYWQDEGAFTGAISAPMLKSAGVQYVVVGHSERRRLFGDSDDIVNRKVLSVLRHGMHPIICVGESLAQRESGKTNQVVLGQVRAALQKAVETAGGNERFLALAPAVAYEPIWAIGSGSPATADDAGEIARLIRETIALEVSAEVARTIPILYGGSIKPENVGEFANHGALDGVLVGGASLAPQSFVSIVEAYTETGQTENA